MDLNIHDDDENVESVNLDMLEAQAHTFVTEKQKGAKLIYPFTLAMTRITIDSLLVGKQPEPNSDAQNSIGSTTPESEFLKNLQTLVNTPSDEANIYTFIKKDLFHAFNMIPTLLSHGARPGFLCAL